MFLSWHTTNPNQLIYLEIYSGRSRAQAPPFILVKKEEKKIAEGRKANRASNKKLAPLSRSGSATDIYQLERRMIYQI